MLCVGHAAGLGPGRVCPLCPSSLSLAYVLGLWLQEEKPQHWLGSSPTEPRALSQAWVQGSRPLQDIDSGWDWLAPSPLLTLQRPVVSPGSLVLRSS